MQFEKEIELHRKCMFLLNCSVKEIGFREIMYHVVQRIWEIVDMNVVRNSILYQKDCIM